jgi:ElaB/YqjD/DUF883 family membrane-anchored ribosome-binding protein
MSKSYHVTQKDLRGFTKQELEKMEDDKDSVLRQYGEKSRVKKEVLKERKFNK